MVRFEGGADSGRRRVVVIDASPSWAEALAQLVKTALGADARSCAPADLAPDDLVGFDVVVLGDGDAVERTRIQHPTGKLVLLAAADASAGSRSGAVAEPDALVSREASGETLLRIVRSLLDGAEVRTRRDRPQLVHSASGPRLTSAESRVLRHLAAGFSNGEIAGSLGISTNTVRTHVQRVNVKLGADSRLRAVALARQSGVLDLPPITGTGP